MKLYEINEELNQLLEQGFTLDCVDEDGQIDEAKVALKIGELQIAFDDKVEGIACFIKDKNAEISAIKNEIDTLTARKKALENKSDSLTEYLSTILLLQNKEKFTTSKVAISFRASSAVEILDETLIPQEFIKQEIKETIDKKGISSALKIGIDVLGARLLAKKNIQIK